MRQTGNLPKKPQITHLDVAHEILDAGWSPGSSYIFQVSWKSVEVQAAICYSTL